MSSTERMMDLMGNISDDLLVEALEVPYIQRNKGKKAFLRIAVAACILMLFMAYVPAGRALAHQIRRGIENLLETIFPPRDIEVYPEGETEVVTHEIYSNAMTQEPESHENVSEPKFVLYYDPDTYEMMEEGECYIIRPKRILYTREDAIDSISALLAGLSDEEAEKKIQERMEEGQRFYDSMSAGEIQITRIRDSSVEEAASMTRQEFCEHYPIVSEITESAAPEGLYLYASEGTEAECEFKEVYFVDDGQGGVFKIAASYSVESAEGHGMRFQAMIRTFEIYAGD